MAKVKAPTPLSHALRLNGVGEESLRGPVEPRSVFQWRRRRAFTERLGEDWRSLGHPPQETWSPMAQYLTPPPSHLARVKMTLEWCLSRGSNRRPPRLSFDFVSRGLQPRLAYCTPGEPEPSGACLDPHVGVARKRAEGTPSCDLSCPIMVLLNVRVCETSNFPLAYLTPLFH